MPGCCASSYQQCALPVFEGLFPPEHDRIISAMLFRFAEWHALAKLRLHTESTLDYMEKIYTVLCRKLRTFCKKTCGEYHTVELPKEKAARLRREGKAQVGPSPSASHGQQGPHTKTFNLRTYKFHAMGDYIRTIKLFGTTDSYTTQTGELAHRAVKAFYPLTSKKNTAKGLSKHEQRQRRLRGTKENRSQTIEVSSAGPGSADVRASGAEPQATKHVLPLHRNSPVDIYAMLKEHEGDPATENFLKDLKNHVLHRLLNTPLSEQDRDFTPSDRNNVIIRNNTLFAGKTLRLRYTTYDVRKESDFICLNRQCDVMLPTGETHPTAHPYWYARVLRIYHVDVRLLTEGAEFRTLPLLWVRWLGVVPGYRAGVRTGRLPKVGFVPSSDPAAFGFLDPDVIIRATHLVPAFADGRSADLLPPRKSIARPEGEEDDWVNFYVNIFVDRDMFMRYAGRAPGHLHGTATPTTPPLAHTSPTSRNAAEGNCADRNWDMDIDTDEEESNGEDEGDENEIENQNERDGGADDDVEEEEEDDVDDDEEDVDEDDEEEDEDGDEDMESDDEYLETEVKGGEEDDEGLEDLSF
ncbi:hypothetical protein HYDPIDRAFT_124385 [Hydnomerulius pinastri MD-312]|nr:hypothetical protein HYDPIDRAFT_124385 [Hydnomerulius pinastri MD-312]